MRKLLKWIIILITLYIVFSLIRTNMINSKNDLLETDASQNTYHVNYPLGNYVEESLDASTLYRNFVIQSMLNFEQFQDSFTLKEKVSTAFDSIINRDYNYDREVDNLQYVESNLLYLVESDSLTHNYEFVARNEFEEEVSGNIAIFGEEDNVNLVISLVDAQGTIDINKSKVLSDDSNTEVLAYLIVEQTQKLYGTTLEPNEACEYFYGSNLEKLAGDISYHAVVAYLLETYQISGKDKVYEKVKEVNINKNDSENFYMSRKF